MHQDPVTQAADFFIDFRAGDGTAAVRARFEKWLRSSPENVQAYLEIAAAWSELPTADPESRIDVEALLEAAREVKEGNVINLDPGRVRAASPTSWRHMRRWACVGSTALLLLAALVGLSLWRVNSGAATYETGIGDQRTLILADGSTVMLNALTTIRVRITQRAREITLTRGQAYFHDTDEPARPFIVRAGRSSVRAIGTEFDVNEEPDRTVVTVLAGKVAVAKSFAWLDGIRRRELLRELAGPQNSLRSVLVSAGEQVTIVAQNIRAPNTVDVAAATAWMQQRLVFDGTPLEKVAQQFNLYSRRRLIIADPSLRDIGISGDYSASDPAALIGFLRSQPTLLVIELDDRFIVTRAHEKANAPPN